MQTNYFNSTIKIKPRKPKKRVVYKSLVTENTYKNKFSKFGKPIVLPYNKLLKRADDVFAAWIRNRDREQGCYANEVEEVRGTCHGFFCNCHLFGRGDKAIRFDEFNCNGGCSYHNQIHDHTLRPKPHIYTGWFIKKYGVEKYEELWQKSYLVKKWTREELLDIIKKYTLEK
jgi:hypothetical protein